MIGFIRCSDGFLVGVGSRLNLSDIVRRMGFYRIDNLRVE